MNTWNPQGGAVACFGVESPDPRLDKTMPLSPGTRLGPYAVTGTMGQDGRRRTG